MSGGYSDADRAARCGGALSAGALAREAEQAPNGGKQWLGTNPGLRSGNHQSNSRADTAGGYGPLIMASSSANGYMQRHTSDAAGVTKQQQQSQPGCVPGVAYMSLRRSRVSRANTPEEGHQDSSPAGIDSHQPYQQTQLQPAAQLPPNVNSNTALASEQQLSDLSCAGADSCTNHALVFGQFSAGGTYYPAVGYMPPPPLHCQTGANSYSSPAQHGASPEAEVVCEASSMTVTASSHLEPASMAIATAAAAAAAAAAEEGSIIGDGSSSSCATPGSHNRHDNRGRRGSWFHSMLKYASPRRSRSKQQQPPEAFDLEQRQLQELQEHNAGLTPAMQQELELELQQQQRQRQQVQAEEEDHVVELMLAEQLEQQMLLQEVEQELLMQQAALLHQHEQQQQQPKQQEREHEQPGGEQQQQQQEVVVAGNDEQQQQHIDALCLQQMHELEQQLLVNEIEQQQQQGQQQQQLPLPPLLLLQEPQLQRPLEEMALLVESAQQATQQQLLQLQHEQQQLEAMGEHGAAAAAAAAAAAMCHTAGGASSIQGQAAAGPLSCRAGSILGSCSSMSGASAAAQVLSVPGGQLLQVSQGEFQEMLAVMEALADARENLERLQQSSGGGSGGYSQQQQQQEGNDDDDSSHHEQMQQQQQQQEEEAAAIQLELLALQEAHPELFASLYCDMAAAADAAVHQLDMAGHAAMAIAAAAAETTGHEVHSFTADGTPDCNVITLLQQHLGEHGVHRAAVSGLLLQQRVRSRSSGGRLEASARTSAAGTAVLQGVEDGREVTASDLMASSGGGALLRPLCKVALKQTLFGFEGASPLVAEAHYLRGGAQQSEAFRIKARSASSHNSPRGLRITAGGGFNRSLPGKLSSTRPAFDSPRDLLLHETPRSNTSKLVHWHSSGLRPHTALASVRFSTPEQQQLLLQSTNDGGSSKRCSSSGGAGGRQSTPGVPSGRLSTATTSGGGSGRLVASNGSNGSSGSSGDLLRRSQSADRLHRPPWNYQSPGAQEPLQQHQRERQQERQQLGDAITLQQRGSTIAGSGAGGGAVTPSLSLSQQQHQRHHSHGAASSLGGGWNCKWLKLSRDSYSHSTDWTDEDSPRKLGKATQQQLQQLLSASMGGVQPQQQQQQQQQQQARSGGCAGSAGGAAASPEDQRTIKQLTQQVAELEGGLLSLLQGQAIPPSAANAIIAAVSTMRQLRAGKAGGTTGGGGAAAALATPGGKAAATVQATLCDGGAAAKGKDQQQQAEGDDELDGVIAAINQGHPATQHNTSQQEHTTATTTKQQQQQPAPGPTATMQQQLSEGMASSSSAAWTDDTAFAVNSPQAAGVGVSSVGSPVVGLQHQQQQQQQPSLLGKRPASINKGVQACLVPVSSQVQLPGLAQQLRQPPQQPPQQQTEVVPTGMMSAAGPAAAVAAAGAVAAVGAGAPAGGDGGGGGADGAGGDMLQATGAFDAARFEQYNRKVDADMARRAAAQDFDSDLEADEAEAAAVAAAAAGGGGGDGVAAALQVLTEAEQQLQALQAEEAKMKALWAEQDEWMNAYRQPASRAISRNSIKRVQTGGDADDELDEHEVSAADKTQQHRAARRGGLSPAASATAAAAIDAAAPDAADCIGSRHGSIGQSPAVSPAAIQRNAGEVPEFAAVVEAIAAEASIRSIRSSRSHVPPFHNHRSMSGWSEHMAALVAQEEEEEATAATAAAAAAVAAATLRDGYCSDEGPDAFSVFQRRQQRHQEGAVQRLQRASSGGLQTSSYGGSATSGHEDADGPVAAAAAAGGGGCGAQRHGGGGGHTRKSIAAVKLEQDLEIRAQAEAARMRHRFAANPVPGSSRQMRYHRLLAEQHARRAATHEKYLQLLTSSNQPFSFHQRDLAEAATKAARREAAHDPNKFQVEFRARRIPRHVREARFEAIMAAYEASRLAARVKAEMARERVAKAIQDEQRRRQAMSAANYKEALFAAQAAKAAAASKGKAAATAAAAARLAAGRPATEGSGLTSASASASSTPRAGARSSRSRQQQQRKLHEMLAQAGLSGDALGVSGSCSGSGAAPSKHVLLCTSYSIDSSGCEEGGSSGGGASSSSNAPHAAAAAPAAGVSDGAQTRRGRSSGPLTSRQGQRQRGLSPELSEGSSSRRPPAEPSRLARSVSDFKSLCAGWEGGQMGGRRASPGGRKQHSSTAEVPDSPCSSSSAAAAAGALPPRSRGSGRPVHKGTVAATLRAEATRQALQSGKYSSREERERQDWEAGRLELQRHHLQREGKQAAANRKQEQQQQQPQQPQRQQQQIDASAAAHGALDAAAAELAGRDAAAALAQGGKPSAVQVAAHLHHLLSSAKGGGLAAGRLAGDDAAALGTAAAAAAAAVAGTQPDTWQGSPNDPEGQQLRGASPSPRGVLALTSPRGSSKVIPPVAAPAKVPPLLQRSPSPNSSSSSAVVRALAPSVLPPSAQASLNGSTLAAVASPSAAGGGCGGTAVRGGRSISRRGGATAHIDACAAAEAALRMAAAALADAAPSLSSSAAAATAAVRAVAEAAAVLDGRAGPHTAAEATASTVATTSQSCADPVGDLATAAVAVLAAGAADDHDDVATAIQRGQAQQEAAAAAPNSSRSDRSNAASQDPREPLSPMPAPPRALAALKKQQGLRAYMQVQQRRRDPTRGPQLREGNAVLVAENEGEELQQEQPQDAQQHAARQQQQQQRQQEQQQQWQQQDEAECHQRHVPPAPQLPPPLQQVQHGQAGQISAAATAASSRDGKGQRNKQPAAAAATTPDLVALPPSQLSVKDRIKAINAALSSSNGATPAATSPAAAAGGGSLSAPSSISGGRNWSRSFGVATGCGFGDDAASVAHMSLIDSLNSSKVGTLVERRRAGLVGRGDAPLMHIEARHAQAERAARDMVDEALRSSGVGRGYRALQEEVEEQQ